MTEAQKEEVAVTEMMKVIFDTAEVSAGARLILSMIRGLEDAKDSYDDKEGSSYYSIGVTSIGEDTFEIVIGLTKKKT